MRRGLRSPHRGSSMKTARFTRPPCLCGIMDNVWNPPLAIFALEAPRLEENNQAYLNAPAHRVGHPIQSSVLSTSISFADLSPPLNKKLPKVKYLGHILGIFYLPKERYLILCTGDEINSSFARIFPRIFPGNLFHPAGRVVG